MNYQEKQARICLCIDQNLNDDNLWVLRLHIPGVVTWKFGEFAGKPVYKPVYPLSWKCFYDPGACLFEEEFNKHDYSREEVIEIGKNICKQYGWIWTDITKGEDEIIDFSEENNIPG